MKIAPFGWFYSKTWVGFCLISPFEILACFYEKISENFERFQYFNFDTDSLKNENLFQKTGVQFFS